MAMPKVGTVDALVRPGWCMRCGRAHAGSYPVCDRCDREDDVAILDGDGKPSFDSPAWAACGFLALSGGLTATVWWAGFGAALFILVWIAATRTWCAVACRGLPDGIDRANGLALTFLGSFGVVAATFAAGLAVFMAWTLLSYLLLATNVDFAIAVAVLGGCIGAPLATAATWGLLLRRYWPNSRRR